MLAEKQKRWLGLSLTITVNLNKRAGYFAKVLSRLSGLFRNIAII